MLQYLKRRNVRKVAWYFVLFLFFRAILLPIAGLNLVLAQTTPKKAVAAHPPARDAGTPDPGTQIPGWVLKFDEEFNGKTLDYSRWSPHGSGKIAWNGIQTWIPTAIELSADQAHITARKTAGGYTSGIITTFGTFAQTYGRFEIRFRMPAGRGLEPLFRLMPIPNGETPSITVMNAIGSDPALALFDNRWGDPRGDREYSGSYKVANLSMGFHIVAVEWDEEKIVWTVDGIERFQSFEGVPHQPMYLAVSLCGGQRSGRRTGCSNQIPGHAGYRLYPRFRPPLKHQQGNCSGGDKPCKYQPDREVQPLHCERHLGNRAVIPHRQTRVVRHHPRGCSEQVCQRQHGSKNYRSDR